MDLALRTSTDPRAYEPSWLNRALFDVPRRHVNVSDARLHVLGDDAPLLFIHGSPLWSFTWRHMMAKHGGVAMDLPGLGDSRAALCDRPFERNASVIEQLATHLDLRGAVIVAHATAGPSAIAAAARLAPRVRALVLINTFGWDLASTPLAPAVRVVSSAPFRWLDRKLALLPRVTARFGRRTGRFTPEERRAWLGPYDRAETRAHLGSMLRGLRTEDAFFRSVERDLLRLTDLPTLLLFGAHDNNSKARHPERFQGSLKRSRLVRLPRSGHFAMEDEPEAVNDALGAFLSELSR